MRSHRSLLARLAVIVAAVAVACDSGPVPIEDRPTGGRAEVAGFVLEVTLPRRVYSSDEVIPVATTLTWTGPQPVGRVWGSGSGPVSFMFAEVGGPRRQMGGAMTADCSVTEHQRGVPTVIPLTKSGGWTAEDPNAAFYATWFRDPMLRLPVGRWQLRAEATGMLAECSAEAPELAMAIAPIELEIR